MINRFTLIGGAVLAMLSGCGSTGDADKTVDITASSADTTPPSVSSVSPAGGATDIAPSTTVTASFDEDIFATTVDGTSFTLAGNGNISGTVSFDGASNVATFTPDSNLALMTTYSATLTTGITDLYGNALAGDYNWSFTTVDGSWGTAGTIESGTSSVYDQQLAIDDDGNAIAVWYQNDGSADSIYANRYVAGSGWGTAETIESGTGAAYSPQIAIDADGNAIAVWQEYDGSVESIHANRYVAGSGWGTDGTIQSGTGYANIPQIAIDADGNAIAVWKQDDGSADSIYANRYAAGSGWGTDETIESGEGVAYDPQIALDADGNAIAVWQQYDGSTYSIYANRYVAGSGWGTAETIESGANSASDPQIAFDDSGNAVAVWYQDDGSANSIYANRYVAGSGWGTAETIESGTWDAYAPQIAIDGSGNTIAVWKQHDGSTYSLYANRFE